MTYGAVSVPAILAGVSASYITLTSTFEIFGSIVAAIGLVVGFKAWRTRPAVETQRDVPLRAAA